MILSRHSRDQSRVDVLSVKSPAVVLLRLLGGAVVEGPRGVIHGRGARGPRIALLAMLAAARGRPITRDTLVATLWPEASEDRARPLLSDSLYLLRAAVGEDAILGTGDELRLNIEAVESDVGRFQQFLADNEYELAVAEYTGPLLDGFHLSEAVEFERWLDSARARFAAGFATALSEVASGHERAQRWTDALPWLRKLASHDPYASEIALRLMRALSASGNRAGALQHARVHTALLREEFGTEPDSAVTALVAQLTSTPVDFATTTERADVASPSLDITSADVASPSAATASAYVASLSSDTASADLASPSSDAASAPPQRAARASDAVLSRSRFLQPRHRWLIMLAVAVSALSAVLLFTRKQQTALPEPTSVAARPSDSAPSRSIAVLPFYELSAAQDAAWFSDGLTEEIIGLLGRVDGLRVAARSSSFALRDAGLEARAMGDTLRVATLLEGSVRRDGNQMRITARLVDVSTGYQLWSSTFDRRVSDAISVQYEIASAIVSALQLRLSPSQIVGAARAPDNPEVRDLYLRGVYLRNKLTREDLAKAVEFFDRAIQLDSSYAPAYAWKATTLGPMMWYGHMPRTIGEPLIRAAAARAIRLDASLSESQIAQGMVAFFFDWNWAAAESAYRRAVELNPNDANAHHSLANLLRSAGRVDEGIAERLRAHELDPLSVRITSQLGSDYLIAGQFDRAAAQFRRAIELEPHSPVLKGQGPNMEIGIGHVHEREHRYNEAFTEYLKRDSLNGAAPDALLALRHAFAATGILGYWRTRGEQLERSVPPTDLLHLAWIWARVGEKEKAVQLIQRAYADRNPGMVNAGVLPDFAEVRKDPRIQRILQRMGLRGVQP